MSTINTNPTTTPNTPDELAQQIGAEMPLPVPTDEEMAELDAQIQQSLDAVPPPSLDAP